MPDDDEVKKVQFAIYVNPARKKEIDDCIYDLRIRNYQDAYREIVDLGFEQFKSKRGKA